MPLKDPEARRAFDRARAKKRNQDPEYVARHVAYCRAHRRDPEERAKYNKYQREWRAKRRQDPGFRERDRAVVRAFWARADSEVTSAYMGRRRQRHVERMAADPHYRIRTLLHGAILRALRWQKTPKSGRTVDLLGCSIAEARGHIEGQFKRGMTWDNIHIDHIRPCISFDLSDPEQQRLCFHFSNLQPLRARDNLSKHAKWDGQTALTV